MAQYCRYCGGKEKDPRDNFCYVCRKAGTPVDYFYRFIRKNTLSEQEQDIIRHYGKTIAGGALIFSILPIAVLIFAAALRGTEKGASVTMVLTASIILAALLGYAAFGVGLMRLDKRAVNKKWKRSAIMFFVGLTRSRRSGAAIVSAVLPRAAPRRRSRIPFCPPLRGGAGSAAIKTRPKEWSANHAERLNNTAFA